MIDLGVESIDHLFFNCDYTKWVLREAWEAIGSLVRSDGMTSFKDAARELNTVERRRGSLPESSFT